MRAFGWVWVLVGLTVAAGVLAILASPLPDGLDTTIERFKLPVRRSAQRAPLPDYAVPGVRQARMSIFIASGIGLIAVFLVTYLIGKLLSRRGGLMPPTPPPSQPDPSGQDPDTQNRKRGTKPS